jgi:hypothetical protein
MRNQIEQKPGILLNGIRFDESVLRTGKVKKLSCWKRHLALALLLLAGILMVPLPGHGQFLGVFNAIFSSIQNDIGTSLRSINQISFQIQKLHQTTIAPLTAINQARGFVANSISRARAQLNQVFNMPFASAVTPGPKQFESVLHSRVSTQISALEASFTTNYGVIPAVGAASPQDRIMMDVDDALGKENLKTTLIADEGVDVVLQTADRMENQVAVSTPGSNPFLTAQAQVANLRCQAYLQKMLAAQLRQEAGRIAHDSVLVKRRTTSTGGINSLITGVLTAR